MSSFVSFNESMVNLEKVSNILFDSNAIKFYRLPLDNNDEETLFEAWYFKDEEKAEAAFEKLQNQLKCIKI